MCFLWEAVAPRRPWSAQPERGTTGMTLLDPANFVNRIVED
jgi:hypothetical protein